MLFLAVFCGLLAENWREHYVEHKRSRELSFSLKTDLVRDTATLKRIIANRKERTEILNRLMDEIEKPQNLRNDTIIVAFGEDELLRRSYFMSDAGTYDQIKQAGFLRYFKKDIGTCLVRYETFRNASSILADIETKFVFEQVVTLFNKLANQKFLRYEGKGNASLFGGYLIKKDNTLLDELYGDIRFLQKRNEAYLYSLNSLYAIALECINQLNEDFDLK